MSGGKLAVYAGSFDPITNGHVDLIRRARCAFENLIIGVAVNPRKKYLFTPEERIGMIRETLADTRIRVEAFSDLLIHYLMKINANVIIRGLRAVTDFDYEFQMALTNHKLAPNIETFFLMASEPHVYLSSSMVKEIVYFNGDVSSMVPPNVLEVLRSKVDQVKKEHIG
ncbi:MAG: pantetheine-phosphate adenylyltransferase [Candidatus Lernaella stagnicola]|nr:pantetheine-phosphate adenylyltransferase [Candidatus Lernaella stagnicola]